MLDSNGKLIQKCINISNNHHHHHHLQSTYYVLNFINKFSIRSYNLHNGIRKSAAICPILERINQMDLPKTVQQVSRGAGHKTRCMSLQGPWPKPLRRAGSND